MATSELDSSSGIPMYKQIKEILRTEILEGVADPGTPMTEAQLLERFGVSRAPIRQALRELTNEGYVFRKQGKGTFPVSGARVDRPADLRVGGLHRYLSDRGLHPTSAVSAVSRVTPPAHVQRHLQVEQDEQLLHFSRVISVDDSPLLTADVYVRPPADFHPTAADLEASGSAFELMEQQYGILLDRAEHVTWATSASAEHAAILGVAENSPLLAIETTFFTTGGVPAGWRIALHLAEEFKYRFVENR
ncbi:GntR family transcriptional regulator [Corynebacterium halotolerans]|uniref:Transcriptional regulator n=1 Tax=Corynebacterium halotolerans YIM 70093 = DSM 44683 TaxID=1121362 RepID=M1NX37_9CORY|nr:GntR family transcriptional regulator [Corynebacterium halotolerans]AGF72050.1 transcriptional regulator [Corynebacterium halotolerans YIM 70093 = DSM 44683]